MKRALPLALVLATSVLVAPSAHALGVYVGASAGNAGFEVDESNLEFDGSDSAYKAFGGVRFFKFFLVEASYNDFGKAEDSSVAVKSDAIGLFGRIHFPIWRFELFGKAGAYKWDVDVDGGGVSGSDDGTDLAYGVGASFRFTNSFAVRAEYETFKLDVEGAEPELDMISAGLEWRFLGN